MPAGRATKSARGTSYAAPFVSGAAALLLAHARRRGRKLHGAEVKSLLIDGARPLSGADPREIGRGVLDIPASLDRLERLLDGAPASGRAG